MIGDIVSNFSQLESKLLRLTTLQELYTKQKLGLESEIKLLNTDLGVLDKVSSLFKHLLDTLLESKKQEIEKLVTYGLKSVFTDQDLKFHIDIEAKYNTIHTTFRTEQVGAAVGNVLDNFGGGIVNLESFLLRLIALFQMKLHPFMFLDESFSHVSESYVDECSKFLNTLCKEFGLTLIVITHSESMCNHADKIYKVKKSDNKLTISI